MLEGCSCVINSPLPSRFQTSHNVHSLVSSSCIIPVGLLPGQSVQGPWYSGRRMTRCSSLLSADVGDSSMFFCRRGEADGFSARQWGSKCGRHNALSTPCHLHTLHRTLLGKPPKARAAPSMG